MAIAKINGSLLASISKVNGVLKASVSKVDGVSNTDSVAPSVPASSGYFFRGTWTANDDTFEWSASTDNVGVAEYELYISKDGSFLTSYMASKDGSNNPYNIIGFGYNHLARVWGSGSFGFKVCAKDAAGNTSAFSTEVFYSMDANKPGPYASSISATNIASTSCTLNWVATTRTDALGYKIYQNNVLIATIGMVTSYNVTGLTASTNYSFAITAYNATNSCDGSGISVNTLSSAPSVPQFLTHYLDTANTIYMEWSLSTNAPVSYELWRKLGSGGTYSLRATITHPTYYYLDSGSYNVTYYYKLRAKNAAGNYSDYSDEIFETTDPISCLVEGTLIKLPDNTQVPIETLVLNQLLLSSKIETLQDTNDVNELYKWESSFLSENRITSPITKIEPKVANETIIVNDGLLEATPSHSQLIQRDGVWRFIRLGDILVGDKLCNIDREIVEVTSVTINTEPRNIYPLTLSPSHTYFANGILTHNIK
jgi:hypothetical protein